MSRNSKKILGLAMVGVFGVFALSKNADAWGERGHDTIARVAARLLAAKIAKGTPIAQQFSRREYLLGHLANIPDILWRNQGEDVEKINAPTHFLDTEYMAPELLFDAVPKTTAAALARMNELCSAKPKGYKCAGKPDAPANESSGGTAPWRIAQLYRIAVEGFKAGPAGEKVDAAAIDRAIVAAGIMGHFVGDLGNPYHATTNYDGWDDNAGGIHGYFESAVVSSYRMALEQEVLDAAIKGGNFERVLKQIPANERASLSRDPFSIGVALALDSHTRLDAANAIDRKFALLKPSGVGPDGKQINAERRDPSELRFKFHDLIVERLATAAEALAQLWFMAWEDAGKPDFKGFRSFAYPIAPTFIQPDYLTPAK